MNIAYFTHSLRSDWNHGNAHFVRGVLHELGQRGHTVRAFEPRDSWSAANLREDAGAEAVEAFRAHYPHTEVVLYDPATIDLAGALEGVDLVLVHEWNPHDLVQRLGELRRQSTFRLLFHDTHHRAVTAPEEMASYDLTHYDGVLAFGDVIRDIYLQFGWAKRAWTWHEAADTRVFRPLDEKELLSFPGSDAAQGSGGGDLVWIGNWGDEERTRELYEFLVYPVVDLGLRARVHGVRYPTSARAALSTLGIQYGGYLPNFLVPRVFATHKVTVHVPRRPYVEKLPGIPTIRPFEALACGIPLVSAPWTDAEGLFRTGQDYLLARDGDEMKAQLKRVLHDSELRESLISSGLETIRSRHTCGHRAGELLLIAAELTA